MAPFHAASGWRKWAITLAAAFLFTALAAGGAGADEKKPVIKKLTGSFLTDVAGSSVPQPPYIQVVRSREGLEYLLGEFERYKNRITKSRIDSLRAELAGLDYGRKMLIGVFSPPMDNYELELKDIVADKEEETIDVKVTWQHKMQNDRIPPKKSIHFILAVIPKSDYPVILQTTRLVSSEGAGKAELVTVTGRLMPLTGGGLQIVPVVIKRGDKNSYYIKGTQAEPLAEHTGKVVTVQGTVSHERDSPYEWDFTVKKIVKIHN